MKKPYKIEFEGIDASGKTTGLKYFIEQAKKRFSVVETREVGNPHIPVCVKLRELVLNPENKLTGEAMEFIFAAMRSENDAWLKNVEPNTLVVSDRGLFSHLAYTDHNVSESFTDEFYNKIVSKITSEPDLVVYFDVDPAVAQKRLVNRGSKLDSVELLGSSFQRKVKESYDKYLAKSDIKLYVIDANQSLENVKIQIDDILSNFSDFYFD